MSSKSGFEYGSMSPAGILCATIAIFAGFSCERPEHGRSGGDRDNILEARISLDVGGRGKYLELHITDAELLRDLLEEPLAGAAVDSNPAKYVVLGSVAMRRKDGSEERFVMFHPWGHYKHGDQYMIADFSSIKKALSEAIDYASRILKSN